MRGANRPLKAWAGPSHNNHQIPGAAFLFGRIPVRCGFRASGADSQCAGLMGRCGSPCICDPVIPSED